ncbi:MAG: ADP-ribosylation factor-like protein [Candidatus Thorarchaeota archaeon]|nr:ADP-ribosylation factor-like protein [Candidatus Thorarchaeota archaeon]
MIHTTLLIRTKSKRTVVGSRYWTIEVPRKDITEYLKMRKALTEVSQGREDIPLTINENKYYRRNCTDDFLLIFITDIDENDRLINEKVETAAESIGRVIEKFPIKHIKETYDKIIAPFVHSRLKIALVGEGGVGKTTTLNLLMGKTPPKQYIPTIALAMETIENIHFANYSLVIWDFAGQERFRRLWKFYFKGADIVFLLTDSTLRNILISKDMYQMIRRDAPNVPIVVIANKQDKPNALDASIIERIIGAETHPMVAVDIAYRDAMLKILLTTAAKHVNVAVPDVPADELLRFIDEEDLEKEEELAPPTGN